MLRGHAHLVSVRFTECLGKRPRQPSPSVVGARHSESTLVKDRAAQLARNEHALRTNCDGCRCRLMENQLCTLPHSHLASKLKQICPRTRKHLLSQHCFHVPRHLKIKICFQTTLVQQAFAQTPQGQVMRPGKHPLGYAAGRVHFCAGSRQHLTTGTHLQGARTSLPYHRCCARHPYIISLFLRQPLPQEAAHFSKGQSQ